MRLALPLIFLAASMPAMAASHVHKPRSTTASVRSRKTVAAAKPAPAGMSSDRATEIQSALIKQGYLTGEPTGSWDANSIAAMQKMQSDNGWQTKFTPDARALNKLGLAGEPAASSVATAEPSAALNQ